MKFLLVGPGKWGKNYLNLLYKTGKLTGVVYNPPIDNSLDKYEECEFFPGLSYVSLDSYDTMIIATQPDKHFEFAERALRHGKHVICEKPCLFTPFQYRKIKELAAKNNRIFFTNYINLFNPELSALKTHLNEYIQNYGESKVNIVNVGNGPFREYSPIWDYGCHAISIVKFLAPENFLSTSLISSLNKNNITFSSNYHNYDLRIACTFGNDYLYRENSVKVGHFEWKDDKSVNFLKIMLDEFENGKVQSNIDLSIYISSILAGIDFKYA